MQRPSNGFPNDAHGAALTAREREVVALIAEGLTNQAIADRLGLARLTVSEHVATILWRLGLRGRHDLAAWSIAQEWRARGHGS